MRVLAFSCYYTPEIAASMYLTEDIYKGIVDAGHMLEVYVPMPCRGISEEVRQEYKRNKIEKKYDGKLVIHRFAMYREGKNSILRAIRYLLINLISVWKGLTTKADVIFVQSTPPTQGMMAGIISKWKKIPLIYNLQDIFPDSLVNSGMTAEGSLLWKIGRKIENYTYKNADKIIVITEGFKRNIMAKGVPEEKIDVISNWIDIDAVQPIDKDKNALYEEFGISREKYIVLYAGNFGAAQGADIILKVAERLKDEINIEFVIFGGGAYFEEAKIQAASLPNVIINGLLPQTRVPEVYSLGDVALICCKPGTGNAGMPSKTWSIMACNTPIIASFDTDSDLADVIRTSGAGQCVEPGSVEKLTEAILNEFNKKNIQLNLRDFVKRYASKEVCVSQYIEEISNVVMGKKK